MFEASSSIQYVLSLASVLHSIQQMHDSSFMCQSLQIKHDVLFCLLFLIATADFSTVSGWVRNKMSNGHFVWQHEYGCHPLCLSICLPVSIDMISVILFYQLKALPCKISFLPSIIYHGGT